MLSNDVVDVLNAERQREVENNLRVRALLGRRSRGRPLTGMVRRLRHTLERVRR